MKKENTLLHAIAVPKYFPSAVRLSVLVRHRFSSFNQPESSSLSWRLMNQSPPVFPKDLGKDIAREDVEEGDVEEDIDQENENTCSLVSEVTKWEKMRQAGQKLGKRPDSRNSQIVRKVSLFLRRDFEVSKLTRYSASGISSSSTAKASGARTSTV